MSHTLKALSLLVFMGWLNTTAYGQCALTIGNLPDTINTCKNTTVNLSPTLIPIGSSTAFVNIDTVWTPAFNLSSTSALNPTATLGTASIKYKLSITSITQQNGVANGDFSQGNVDFTSDYRDTTGPGSLWPESYYAITTNPFLVHPNFASFGDHTSGTGNMMVINGAGAPVNIWCQTIVVLPNTQYDFSAWGASCTPTNTAQVQFEINGALIGTTLSLPSTTGQWTEFHTVWYSGANTSITICIHDQQTALSGNDFALDDISFREICTVTDSVYIHVTNMEPAINANIKLGCMQDTVDVTAGNNAGDQPNQYKWDFGDGTYSTQANNEHIYAQQGQYTLKLVTSNAGCGDSITKKIDTRHPMSVGFTVDKDTICATQSITFTNTDATTGPATYYWNFGDSSAVDVTGSPVHQYNKPGTYLVTHVVSDQIPCRDTITKTVLVQPLPQIKLTVNDSVLCQGTTSLFSGAYTSGTTFVNWDFGDGDQIVNPGPINHAYYMAGKYVVTLTANYKQCPAITDTKNITVLNVPNVNIGPDTTMCPYSDPVPLVNTVANSGNVQYLWSTGDTTSYTQATQPGIYWLQISNASGCFAADSAQVFQSCYMDIPNAFTPNGDGANDYFFPRQLLAKQVTKFHMEIFNRWGEVIFQTNNISGRGWDGMFNGKAEPEGVYIYSIDAQINGYPEEKIKGNVTLLR